jgi:hypothetical protein
MNVQTICAVSLSLLVFGCSNDGPPPYGAYGFGAYCGSDYDCGTGYCCESPACGHGTCSFHCDSDYDCPNGTLCEGHVCFVGCRNDADCYAPQRCKTPRGVCQF